MNPNWAVLSDEQMSIGYPFSLLNDEQMSNKVGVEHQPVMNPKCPQKKNTPRKTKMSPWKNQWLVQMPLFPIEIVPF